MHFVKNVLRNFAGFNIVLCRIYQSMLYHHDVVLHQCYIFFYTIFKADFFLFYRKKNTVMLRYVAVVLQVKKLIVVAVREFADIFMIQHQAVVMGQ